MKILLIGDTHGEPDSIVEACEAAIVANSRLIISLGDFGFMFDSNYMSYVDQILGLYDIDLMWLDGNHENFNMMADEGLDINSDTIQHVTSRISYLGRGARFSLAGVSFMAFGGAVSVDRSFRATGIDWWPQERITASQVSRVTEEPVDVLLTHDAPGEPFHLMWKMSDNMWNKDPQFKPELSDSRQNREFLQQVKEKVNPNLIVHGHFHYAYTTYWDDTRYYGLSCYGMNKNMMILNTENIQNPELI